MDDQHLSNEIPFSLKGLIYTFALQVVTGKINRFDLLIIRLKMILDTAIYQYKPDESVNEAAKNLIL